MTGRVWPMLSMAVAVSAQAGVYKCEVDGQITYQSGPCENGEKINVRMQSSGIAPIDSLGNIRPGERELIRNLDMRNAAKAHKIMRGMTEKRVIYAWGRPDKINRGSSSVPDQWVYRRNRDMPQYIYFRNGKVIDWN